MSEFSMDDIIAKKKAVVRRVTIQTDGDIGPRIAALREKLQAAERYDRRHNQADTAPAIQAELDEAIEQAKESEHEFSFRSIGRPAYDALVEQHPPRAEEKKQGGQFNSETFPPALIAAASHEPKITPEQATEIFNSPDWNNAELLKLWYAAFEANTESADIPLSGSGSGSTLASVQSLLSQLGEGSPTPSSSDG